MAAMVVDVHPLRAVYVVVFALTAVVCFAGITRSRRRLEDGDARWGLTALLATSGLWASFHVGRMAAPSTDLKVTFYVLGLVTGLSTVGAWLYFCSAYAGESYHRQPAFRWLAVGLFAGIVAVKATSTVHGLYFTTTTDPTPFSHLNIRLGVLHWVVTGLAYALSAVGFYILFDLFQESGYATRRLGLLVGLAGLPVVFDIVGYASPDVIVTMNYEPVGVALFAVGVLYVADGRFVAVRQFAREQLLDELEEGIVLLDDDGVIRDVNDAARELFPALQDSLGEPVATAVPSLAEHLPVQGSTIVEFDDAGAVRYYLLSTRELTAGRATIGRALVLTDVTDVERQRREIERQRAQLDDFAEAVTHELRNALMVVEGHLEIVEARLDPSAREEVVERLTAVSEMVDRMDGIVSDLAVLAQHGQPVEQSETVDVARVAREAFGQVSGDDRELVVSGAGALTADEDRLEILFARLFEFQIGNGATRIELTGTDGGFAVTGDGRPLSPADAERAFSYGQAVPDAETGMLLPVVRTLADAHGWTVTLDPEYEDGVRIVVA